MTKELVVNVNSETIKKISDVLPIFGVLLLMNILFIRTMKASPIRTTLLVVLSGFAVLLFIVIIAGMIQARTTRPVAILNDDGIWTKQFGLIPWSNIRDISLYHYKKSPLELIGIYVHDTKQLHKQASLTGKSMLFWSRRMGIPPITLSNIALPNNTVVNFAKQFITKKWGQ